MSAALDRLTTAVSANTAAVQALIASIPSPAALDALSTEIESTTAAAVAATAT